MNHFKKLLILFIALISSPLYSLTLETIELQGHLKKTKEQTVLDIIGFREGDQITDADLESIKQNLIKSGLFVNESIETELKIDEDSADLILTLEDRFSLLPIPMLVYGDSGFMGGLFLMDRNFLGMGNQFFTGAVFGENMQFATASYTDKSVKSSDFDIGFNLGFSNREEEIEDVQEKRIDGYDLLSLHGVLFSTWNSDPYSITAAFDTGYSTYDFEDSGIMFYSPQLGVSFDNRYFQQYMSRGIQADLDYGFTAFGSVFEPTHLIKTSAIWEILPAERIKLSTSVFANYYNGTIYNAPSPESNLYSDLTRAESFFETQFETTFVLADFSKAYLALPLSYNMAYLDGFSGDHETAHGPGIGMSLYLKEIAIPAVSFQYTRNLVTDSNQISFSIGMGGG